ncbi:hypothetical protein JCM33374_g1069 [Metschnikowia sp. JCM 33374]|nr:hypothetical protein JCM33374_g1069 [Metschnikowia sp. JCM 33374]
MSPLHNNNPESSAPAPASTTAPNMNTATASAPSSPGAPGTGSSSGSHGTGKRRLSLFSFGLGSSASPSSGSSKNKALPNISTSPSSYNNSPLHNNNQSTNNTNRSPLVKSPSSSMVPRGNSQSSPVISPVSETDSLSENPGSHIFERSVQDMTGSVKHEDYIPPALDATASILSDSSTDLDNVEMVYSSRRNSSVIGLNMALGRPYTPSRKNSVYSVSHFNNGNNATANSPVHVTSSSSLNYSAFGGNNNFQSTTQPSSNQNQQNPQSPVSPPKLMSSRSSVSFYSYADMINNDEFSRRPSLMHAYSHGFVPTVSRKMSVASNHSAASNIPNSNGSRSGNEFNNKFPRKNPQPMASPSESQSQLSKQFKDRSKPAQSKAGEKLGEDAPLKKFLISPESSDSEDQEIFHPAASFSKPPCRRKSIASNSSYAHSVLDNDSFVSSSVGDCIRQCTTEIENN